MTMATSPRTHQEGASLLEVLIALLIFSFGMLGVAALQTYSVKANQSANFRSQATALANIAVDNIRANRLEIVKYYSDAYVAASCDDEVESTEVAQRDLELWRQQVACQLPEGRTALVPISDREVAVCIRWSDARLDQGDAVRTTCHADASHYGAGAATGGTGAGRDGDATVFVVVARL